MQNKNRAYFVFSRQRVGGGAAKSRLSSNPLKSAILLHEKSAHYQKFEDNFRVQKGWGGGDFGIVSRRQNMRDFYFARIPNLRHALVVSESNFVQPANFELQTTHLGLHI